MALLRWMRRRAKCCCMTCCGVFVFIIASLALFGRYLYKKEHCTDVESKQIIEGLCDLYSQGEVTGSLCSALCESRDLHYQTCTNYRKGKKVLFLTCDSCIPGKTSVSVVLKMKTDLSERDQLDMSHLELDTEQRQKDYVREVEFLVKNSFMFLRHKDMSKHKDILSFAWGWNFHEYLKNSNNRQKAVVVASSSLWSLTEQQEYLMSRDLYNYSFIPRIYGTCGPAYVVENTQTLGNYEFEMFKGWPHSWKERAAIALKLIHLIKDLDNLGQKLHLCDIKPDNFGLRDNGEVTLIDTDCAMFERNLLEQFNHTNCTKHDDCDFFDCRGFCDTKTKQCLLERTNNNMQSLCEDVFVGYFPKMPTGLLRDPPGAIKVELFKLLQECSNPVVETERHNARQHAQPNTVKKLQELLLRSIVDLS
ncbi:divergent protein kinase domain 1C-like [Mercenaria mercenaria]|uniref:divergent protein kinase domain 1C-like n=1 Tax=Mercenaria mercenaria TaxID=6596 RepID=UPI00234F87FD|nr:divergent protein kinase domain 1C-like [Mercenaria mercenaria]